MSVSILTGNIGATNMGLDTSHDCWSGGYGAFMTWREAIAKAAGYPPLRLMQGFYKPRYAFKLQFDSPFFGTVEQDVYIKQLLRSVAGKLPIEWDYYSQDVLTSLLSHSDCDGILECDICSDLAGRLDELLPKLEQEDDWILPATIQFIGGLREAYLAGEDVVFS